jgi:N-acetylmuramoyl-L-alanine amidase
VAIYHKYFVDDPDPTGTETYIFTARKEGDKERAILEGEAAEDTSDTPAPETPEDKIQAEAWAKVYFLKSLKLGSMIQDEFAPMGRDRGVMQRYEGIRVLESTNMPSVLVETGYLSNRQEEDWLNSDEGQQDIADAITRAVIKYKAQVEGKSVQGVPDSTTGNKQ